MSRTTLGSRYGGDALQDTWQDRTDPASSHARVGIHPRATAPPGPTLSPPAPHAACPCRAGARQRSDSGAGPAAQQNVRLSHSVAGDSAWTRLRPAHAATAAEAPLTACRCLPEGPGSEQSTDPAVAWAGASQSYRGDSRTLSRFSACSQTCRWPCCGASSLQIR